MAPGFRAVLLLLLIPACLSATRVQKEVRKAALDRFRDYLRSQGVLQAMYQEALAAAEPGEAANHAYEKLVREAWKGIGESGQQVYLGAAMAAHTASVRDAGRATLQVALARGAGSSQGCSAPTASPPGDSQADTVPGLPAVPAQAPQVPPPPSRFGAFLEEAFASSSSSSSSSAPASPVTPAGDTQPGVTVPAAPPALPTASPGPSAWWGAGLNGLLPALLAAASQLPDEALAAWLSHASLGQPFACFVQALAAGHAVPSSDVVHVLVSAAGAVPGGGPAALAAAAVFGRLGRPVSLAEAVQTSLHGVGLMDPVIAGALLVAYGGAAQFPMHALLHALQALEVPVAAQTLPPGQLPCPPAAPAPQRLPPPPWRAPGPQAPPGPPPALPVPPSAATGSAGPSGSGLPPPPGRAATARPPAPVSKPTRSASSRAGADAAPPGPCGSGRRSRRSAARPPQDAGRFRRGLPPRADGRALDAKDILRLAATWPAGSPFYTRGDQAIWLFGSNGRIIGVGLRPVGGGGSISIWLRQGKVTVSGTAAMRERLLAAIAGWTVPWAGTTRGGGALPPGPAALAAEPPPALAAPSTGEGPPPPPPGGPGGGSRARGRRRARSRTRSRSHSSRSSSAGSTSSQGRRRSRHRRGHRRKD